MGHPTWASNSRTGPIRKHKKLSWFACEGLIAMYDERGTGAEDYTVLTPEEFHARAVALNEFASKMPKSGATSWQRQESRIMIQACQDMEESIKEAKHMGDPSDPTVRDFWRRHRRSSTITMSKKTNDFELGKPRKSVEQIASEGRGRKTTDKPMSDAAVKTMISDAQYENVRRLPVKKSRPGKLILDL